MLSIAFVLSNRFGQTATRVAIACVDNELRAQTVMQLQRAGAVLAVYSDLRSFTVVAEQCDVALIFADGLTTTPILACIDSLEGLRAGPTLIVVTDPVPPLWTPKLERDRLAAVITVPIWTRNGLDLVRTGSRFTRAVADSRPELPFTD